MNRHRSALGMVVLDFVNPFYSELARAAEQAASGAGYFISLSSSRGSVDVENDLLASLGAQSLQGGLITPVRNDAGHLLALRERALPLVLLDCPSPDGAGCSVAVDNVLGGYLAGQHLLSMGHEHIVMLNGPPALRTCSDRREGLLRAVAEGTGRSSVQEVVVPSATPFEGQAATDVVLGHAPSAVYCVNDQVALGLMRGLTERGVSVPDDVAVVGYDDVEYAYSLQPPLTTLRQPTSQMGTVAVELLVDELQHPDTHVHEQVLLKPRLVIRDSSGA